VKPTIIGAIKCNTLSDKCGGSGGGSRVPSDGRNCGDGAMFVFVGVNIKISIIEAINGKRDSKFSMI
jgi:hypothetical protein